MSKILQPNTHIGNDGKSKRKLFTLKKMSRLWLDKYDPGTSLMALTVSSFVGGNLAHASWRPVAKLNGALRNAFQQIIPIYSHSGIFKRFATRNEEMMWGCKNYSDVTLTS